MNIIETKNRELQVFRDRRPGAASSATVPPSSDALHTHDGAQATLIKLILMYPEREELIREKYREYILLYDLPMVESLISSEVEPMVPQIHEERAERERRIRDPKTRNSVILLTDYDRELKVSLDGVDARRADTLKAREATNDSKKSIDLAKSSDGAAQSELDAAKAHLKAARDFASNPQVDAIIENENADRIDAPIEAAEPSPILHSEAAALSDLAAAKERLEMAKKKA
jgi:hypothetical protein